MHPLRQQRCANTWKELLISYASHQTTLSVFFFWNGTFSRDILWFSAKTFFVANIPAIPLGCDDVMSTKWALSYPVILRILGFFSSSFSRNGSLSTLGPHPHAWPGWQTYIKTTIMLKFNNSSTKFLKYLAKRWWFLGCFFHAPGMNCSTGWQLEPRAPLNWIRDVARDVRH